MVEGRNAFKILTGIPTGKRPLGRFRHRWESNIRMDHKGIGANTRNWVDSPENRDYWRSFVNAAWNLRFPLAMEIVAYMYKINSNKMNHNISLTSCFH